MNSLYGNYRTRKFTDVFGAEGEFTSFITECPIPSVLTEEHVKILYYLLYAKYGNSHIASSDENRFKFDLARIIFTYGTQWEKRLEIQEALKDFTMEDIITGQQFITNHAMNPGEGGTTTEDDVLLTYINDQNVSKTKRQKTTALMEFYQAIQTPTENFIDKFKNLFLKIVEPEEPLYYVTEGENI